MKTYLERNIAALLNLAYSHRKRALLDDTDDWLADEWGTENPSAQGNRTKYARKRKGTK